MQKCSAYQQACPCPTLLVFHQYNMPTLVVRLFFFLVLFGHRIVLSVPMDTEHDGTYWLRPYTGSSRPSGNTLYNAAAAHHGTLISNGNHELNALYQGSATVSHESREHQPAEMHESTWFDHSEPTGQELDDTDLGILDSLMKDLSHWRQDANGAVSKPPESSLERQRPDGNAAGEGGSPGKFSNELQKNKVAGLRSAMNWPEPNAMREIDYIPRLSKQGRSLRVVQYKDANVRHLINSVVFGGRLQWYDPADLPNFVSSLAKKSPAYSASRLLPFLDLPDPTNHGARMRIYMTDHGIVKSDTLKSTALKDKPYYAFWASPSQLKRGRIVFYCYGVGHIPLADSIGVDNHMRLIQDLTKHLHA